MSRFVLGITPQLVGIDLSRRLSRRVRNLTELLHRSNLMEYDGYEERANIIPDVVTIVCLIFNQVTALVQVPT